MEYKYDKPPSPRKALNLDKLIDRKKES